MTSPLRLLRQIVRPPGRHRATDADQPAGLDDQAPRDGLLDDAEVEVLLTEGDIEANESAWCGAEQRITFHAMHADGSRTCWICQTTTGGGS